jgi:tRNA G46 methylase TrmB
MCGAPGLWQDVNAAFVGLEWHRASLSQGLKHVHESGLTNIRIASGEAAMVS